MRENDICVTVLLFLQIWQNTMVGINFADETEALNFKEVLDNKLESKRQRRNGMCIFVMRLDSFK